MSSYHQMGDKSANLIEEVTGYAGAIASPVNDDPPAVAQWASRARERGLEVILDPQFYYPMAQRGKLTAWPYFPADFDTADRNSPQWWNGVVDSVAGVARDVGAHSVCSPAVVPANYGDDYYAFMVAIGNGLVQRLGGQQVLQTVVLNLPELARQDRAMSIASLVSTSHASRIYLVVLADLDARRPLVGPQQDLAGPLTGVLRIISSLERAGLPVVVGYCGLDMLLWKAAGASSCATGKHWNLRRFTPARWEPATGGGPPHYYWAEEGLVTFLRNADVLRASREGLLCPVSLANPFAQRILSEAQTGTAWLGVSWRQYMHWFADAEARVTRRDLDVQLLLATAERTWLGLQERAVLFEDPLNDGSWIRPWRQALSDLARP